MSSQPATIKKEVRKLQIEVEIKDKKTGQTRNQPTKKKQSWNMQFIALLSTWVEGIFPEAEEKK